jgi:phosphate transport system protein
MHLEVDKGCVDLLARQSPMAADLRLIVAIIKINSDLERMGDQAVNISHNGEYYLAGAEIKALVDLPEMARRVREMVHTTLDAFVKMDEALARFVLNQDDAVDGYKHKIFADVKEIMKANPDTIDRGLNLILIARNLERVGDHATNIAEDVIFALNGADIRHRGISK